ncbi:hypothetical protein Barb7_00808 [Bacteroidales bacterium Barb7]|nr:hypothetical protein Barb7_00808 [Bacteroidales bacterium Barb7]
MVHISPARDWRFQPHMQRSGMWGYKDDDDTVESCKDDRILYCIVNHHLHFVSPFQGFIGLYPFVNPTFRRTSCGAEIFCPFG